jgi:hypothetical protein
MTAPNTAGLPANLDFLDSQTQHFLDHKAQWERDEARLAGGDAMLDELFQFEGESDASFQKRKKVAIPIPLPLQHASNIVGHIGRKRPTPGNGGISFGDMGKVREVSDLVRGTENLAELQWYNVDGVGQDGSQWPAWFDAVHERAIATGFRWIMAETPPLPAGMTDASAISEQDERDGFRVYAVEWSPLDVPYHVIQRGVLQMAIVRVPDDDVRLENGRLTAGNSKGYYLQVRKGFTGLGTYFQAGGWWIFDKDKKLVRSGNWERTNGQIPMFRFFGKMGRGTTKKPAMAESLTMELGQLATAIMNADSARFFDFWDACASRLFFLGADPAVMKAVADQIATRNMLIGVPPVESSSGTGQDRIVQVYDGSTGAVPAEVSKVVIDALWDTAKSIMLRHLTSTPDSSGASKEAGFAEASQPLLVRLAITREQAEQNYMYFAALRSKRTPNGTVSYPREFDLLSAREQVADMITTMKESRLRSPTLEALLLMRAADAHRLLTDATIRAKVQTELLDSASQAGRVQVQDNTLMQDIDQEIARAAAATNGATPPAEEPATTGA